MEPFAQELFDALKELNLIEESELSNCFEISKKQNVSFQELLLNKDLISDENLGKIVADIYKLPFVNLETTILSPGVEHAIPEEFAKLHKVFFFGKEGDVIKLGIVDPQKAASVEKFIAQKLNGNVKKYYVTERDLEKALHIFKQNLQQTYEDMLKSKNLEKEKETLIESVVNALLTSAYGNRASDIHIEPEKEKSIVRFRIDGVLHQVLTYTPEIHKQIIARIKFLAKLRTDEHLNAQDGKINIHIEEEDIDIRVSLVPVVHGEKAELRLLSSRFRQFGLSDLGMSKKDLEKVMNNMDKPYGMILSTGPTGSGKTTTMYAILKILNTSERNIATIEDPIEYEVEGINQIQVNPLTNITFAEGLRSILRQDPNIIYVGEIRDRETADIAVNSAMTGHLVLSTLHTNDAATALPRLLDMGIEPFLVASTVNVVIAQRLVRKICDNCRYSQTINLKDIEKQFPKTYLKAQFGTSSKIRIYKGKGCSVCQKTGYVGRIGIFEILEITEPIKNLIIEKADANDIREKAIKEGMRTMMEDGVEKIQEGVTTIDEVIRVTQNET